MSTALEELFATTRSERAILIGYIPAGFPTQEASYRIIQAMIDGGVDAIEIGFPYSDPVMDGPIIQAAADQALANGVGAKEVFETLRFAADLVPSVIMTYWNPIERFGVDNFAKELAAHGGSGVITPDLTIEESKEWIAATDSHQVNRIYVVAQSTQPERLQNVTSQTNGFIYAASLMGVTGLRTSVASGAHELVARIRAVSEVPIAVGLGVSNAEQAAEVAGYADGVIVGSAFIRAVQEANSLDEGVAAVRLLAESLAAGVRSQKR